MVREFELLIPSFHLTILTAVSACNKKWHPYFSGIWSGYCKDKEYYAQKAVTVGCIHCGHSSGLRGAHHSFDRSLEGSFVLYLFHHLSLLSPQLSVSPVPCEEVSRVSLNHYTLAEFVDALVVYLVKSDANSKPVSSYLN